MAAAGIDTGLGLALSRVLPIVLVQAQSHKFRISLTIQYTSNSRQQDTDFGTVVWKAPGTSETRTMESRSPPVGSQIPQTQST